ncbi:DMT family transporter [Shewanella sp. VB17]|nr:DMT family transporter [Shewanella sp. VB17]
MQNNFKLGLLFISTAVLFWGILPIALTLSSSFIDPVTLTWFRFLVAFVITFVIQHFSGHLDQFTILKYRDWLKLFLAGVFLILNYVSFVYALKYLAPGVAQLNFQTAPFFLAFGGMLFFKEKLSAIQLTCFATLALGMLLFFNPYLNISHSENSEVWSGLMMIQFSVCSWTSYALLQKSLLKKLDPNNVLLFIYGLGILVMMVFCDFSQFGRMGITDWWVAIFCAVNTLIAYGCFGASMKYWPTSQVSAMLALTPVFSFASTAFVVSLGLWPEKFTSDNVDLLSVIGISIIIFSVMLLQLLPAMSHRKAQLITRKALQS